MSLLLFYNVEIVQIKKKPWIQTFDWYCKSIWKSIVRLENGVSTNDQQPNQQSLKNLENNNGQMLHNPGVEST
jgi:hypothetical protein